MKDAEQFDGGDDQQSNITTVTEASKAAVNVANQNLAAVNLDTALLALLISRVEQLDMSPREATLLASVLKHSADNCFLTTMSPGILNIVMPDLEQEDISKMRPLFNSIGIHCANLNVFPIVTKSRLNFSIITDDELRRIGLQRISLLPMAVTNATESPV